MSGQSGRGGQAKNLICDLLPNEVDSIVLEACHQPELGYPDMSLASQFSVATAAAGRQVPLGRLPAHHARGNAPRPMLTFGDRTITFGEFDIETNRLAHLLVSTGIQPGDFVALILPNGIPVFQFAFALWKIGATPVPLSHKLPSVELRAILDLLQPRLVIEPSLTAMTGVVMSDVGVLFAHNPPSDPLPDVELQYWKASTSGGSTGRPKVIVSHMLRSWDPTSAVFGAVPGSCAINVGPLYHNAPFNLAVCHMFSGSHVVEAGGFDPERTLDLIERFRVQWINLVPTMMHRIWRLGPEVRARHDLSSLRHVWHMASMCPPWLKENWIEWLGPERIFEGYGGSEGNGGTSITGVEWLGRKGSVGRCNPGYTLRIFSDAGQLCAPGEPGEIYMAPEQGKDPGFHYIGAEANVRDGLVSLGDIGYLDDDGYLYLLDRRTDMIVSGGANVYPAEVESAIEEHPAVGSSLVIGLPDADWGQRVHALVELTGSPGSVSDADLRQYLRERLASHKIPKSFEFVSKPLRDEAGKARRSGHVEQRAPASR